MTATEPQLALRRIRSFVRREGRITTAQAGALALHWPQYGIAPEGFPLDLDQCFGRSARRIMEIGFGNGDHLLARAAAESEHDFLGVEVHRPGVGRVLHHAAAVPLRNLRVAAMDAVELLRDGIAPASIDELLVYFPDPWPKKRHHKRRLIQPAFVALVATRLRVGGLLKLATDWAPYAEQMLDVLEAEPTLRNTSASGFLPRPDRRETKFEARGTRLGHSVFDLVYQRA